MIRQKIGKCIDCDPNDSILKPLIARRCEKHYWQYRKSVSKKNIRQLSADHQDPVPLKEKTALGLWFKYHIEHNLWICENCKDPIPHHTSNHLYAAQAHIVPKLIYTSVKSNLDNHMSLCSYGSNNNCHYSFDFSWSRASRMPVMEVAKKRFLKFCHLLTNEEKEKLPSVFLDLM
jgi:hypothetical protein